MACYNDSHMYESITLEFLGRRSINLKVMYKKHKQLTQFLKIFVMNNYWLDLISLLSVLLLNYIAYLKLLCRKIWKGLSSCLLLCFQYLDNTGNFYCLIESYRVNGLCFLSFEILDLKFGRKKLEKMVKGWGLNDFAFVFCLFHHYFNSSILYALSYILQQPLVN